MKEFTRSRRYTLTILVLSANILLFAAAMFIGKDLIDTATALSILMVPAYSFIAGDTIRPSVKIIDKEKLNG